MIDIIIAEAVLGLHLVIITFNVAGLILIPVCAWLGWRIIRLHLATMGVVAGQALGGRARFLTVWQNGLAGGSQSAQPLIMHWVDGLIYWNLPMWAFAAMYSVVFLYVLALRVLVPFGRRRGGDG